MSNTRLIDDTAAGSDGTSPLGPGGPGDLPLAPADPIVLDRKPGGVKTIAMMLWRARRRPQGELRGGAVFPALTVRLHGVRLTSEAVSDYRSVCHLPSNDRVAPLPMPEVLFSEVLGRLITDPRFHLSPFGLIHVGQTLEARRPVVVGRPYDLEARLAGARRTNRGYELDMRLNLADRKDSIWEAVTTLLSRAPELRARERDRTTHPTQDFKTTHEVSVSADTGRAYARVSGDWNPHHLWPITAKPLGYSRPIAHGMWTLARLVGLLPADVDTTVGSVEVTFHRPVMLPGSFAAQIVNRDDGWRLDAFSPERGSPHVLGTLCPA